MNKKDHLFLEAGKIINRLYDESLCERIKHELYEEYVSLLRRSAYLGNPEAQFELGQTYEDINFWGDPTLYNPKKLFYWYQKACEGNYGEACNSLAHMYELGVVVERDLQKALKLYEKASLLGSDTGKRNYKLMLKQLKS